MSSRDPRRGSVALESAIAVVGFVLVSLLFLQGILSVVAGLRVETALERTTRILALGAVAADFAGADRWATALADATGIDPDGFVPGLMEQGILSGLGDALLPSLFDACFTSGSREAPWLDGLFAGTGAERWTTSCETRLDGGWVRVTVRYALRTPFGAVGQVRTQAFALWNDGDGTRDARVTSNVWDLDNLERGRAVRIRFGGNLPMGYPVIASYRNGTATAIHSMDLSPYGWHDASGARKELAGWIGDLAGFDGTAAPWGADAIDVPPGAVTTRRLILVVPVNTDEGAGEALLDAAVEDAAWQGVRLDVVHFQERRAPVAGE